MCTSVKVVSPVLENKSGRIQRPLLVPYLEPLFAREGTIERDHSGRPGRERLFPDEIVGKPGLALSERLDRPVNHSCIRDDDQFGLEKAIEDVGDRCPRQPVSGLQRPGDVDEHDVGDIERGLPLPGVEPDLTRGGGLLGIVVQENPQDEIGIERDHGALREPKSSSMGRLRALIRTVPSSVMSK